MTHEEAIRRGLMKIARARPDEPSFVPQSWVDEMISSDLLEAARNSACFEADTCVLDPRCPFAADCRIAEESRG